MPVPSPPPTRRKLLVRRSVATALGVGAVGVVVWLAVTFTGTGAPAPRAAPTTATAPHPTTTTLAPTTTTTTTTSVSVTTTTIDPGSLPQTDALPSSTSPQFQAAMGDLFGAVALGTPAEAAPAFFPEAAYVQLKVIPDASYDWQHRLLAEFDEDLATATAGLGPDAASSTLVSVQVPMQYAHWVPAGVCENSVGYFEVANSRLVYSLGGVVRSFGIASLISWRGEWYVVHLGAVLRPGNGGVLLDPEVGPGYSPPSGTC